MVKSAKLRWKIYFFLVTPLMISGLSNLFFPESNVYTYYNVLISFHENYTLTYFLAVASATMSVASLVPLGLFILRIRFLKETFWRGFFFLKILLDLFGHHFEFNFLKSLLHSGLWQIFLTVAAVVIIFFPSYLACYIYAFRRDTFLTEPEKS